MHWRYRFLLIFFGILLCSTVSLAQNCSNTTIGTATCVQQASNINAGAGSTSTATLTSVSASNKLLVETHYCQDLSCNTNVTFTATLSDTGTSSCTPSPNAPYTTAATNQDLRFYAWLCTGLSAGTHAMKITTSSSSDYLTVVTQEMSGLGTAFDGANVDSSTLGTGSNPSVSTSGATTNANDLIVGYITVATTTPTVGAGFTEMSTASGVETEAKTVSSAGTQTAVWVASAQSWEAIVFPVKLSAATPTVPNDDDSSMMIMLGLSTAFMLKLFLDQTEQDRGIMLGTGKLPGVPFAFKDDGEEKLNVTMGQSILYDDTPEANRAIVLGLGKSPPVPAAPVDEAENKVDYRWQSWQFERPDEDEPGKLAPPPTTFTDDGESKFDASRTNWSNNYSQSQEEDEPGFLGRPAFAFTDDGESKFDASWTSRQPSDDDSNRLTVAPIVAPNIGLDDLESIFKPYEQKTMYDHTAETDEPGTIAAPPTVLDDPNTEKWVAWSVPAIEDDHSFIAPIPPQVIPDDADSSRWSDTRAIQYDDTDTQRGDPPRPPTTFTDDGENKFDANWIARQYDDTESQRLSTPRPPLADDPEIEKWSDVRAIQHDDTDTQRPSPPTPPAANDADISVWTSWAAAQPEDFPSHYPVAVPIVAPNIGLDDIESTFKTSQYVVPTGEEDTRSLPPTPPTTYTDDGENKFDSSWRQNWHEDTESQRINPPPPPRSDDPEISFWTATRSLHHEDTESQRSDPPIPPLADDSEVSQWVHYKIAYQQFEIEIAVRAAGRGRSYISLID